MQILATCFTFILSLWWCNAIQAKDVIPEKVDSIYQGWSNAEKASRLIWLHVDNQDSLKAPPSVQTLYLTDKRYLSDKKLSSYNIAYQMDPSLNPGHEINLPGLSVLASINDERLITEYLGYLKSLGRSLGIDYMVLPKSQNPRESDLLTRMHLFAPHYFLTPGSLTLEPYRKKKEISEAFMTWDFWVVGHEVYEDATGLMKKVSKKMTFEESEEILKQHILNLYFQEEVSEPLLTKQMDFKIKTAAVALLERKRVLPLARDTLCLITKAPYGGMANMLRNYVYLITSLDDIVTSEAPIIADYSPLILPDLSGRTMIYVGQLDQFDEALFDAALITPFDDEDFDFVVPQQLFGAMGAHGSIADRYDLLNDFDNAPIEGRGILGFAPPWSAGISPMDLDSMTQIINEGLLEQAFPGCQLAIAYQGAIIHEGSYGYLTYDSLIPVTSSTVYDLASVTKVAGTLQALMQLYDQNQIDLDQSVAHYLPRYLQSNKQDITLKALLSHQAGLLPYVPFWKRTLKGDFLEPFYEDPSENQLEAWSFGLKPDMSMRHTMSNWIVKSPLLRYDSLPYYSYSDIGFLILQELVEEITRKPLDQYMNDEFFQPLCLEKIGFNPKMLGMDLHEIAPTEFDQVYRSEQIWGEVHDRNAALLNGVGGHAGLFANASDLVVLMQMILQGGEYGGQVFFNEQTLNVFNSRYFPNNRRALGWDKKDDYIANVSSMASDQSFGHTGFTGTMVWVDPVYDLVFVFLTNRIHPDSNNRKLNELNIRTRIMDVIYKSIQAKNPG